MNHTKFYIVRHGQTDWNVAKKLQGHQDIPLNQVGKVEAHTLAKEMNQISYAACFSSDLQRAHETAAILTAGMNITIKTDTRLRERNFGKWEGSPVSALKTIPQEDFETRESLRARVFQLLKEATESHPGENVLVVTHGGVICNLISQVLSVDLFGIEVKNTSVLHLHHFENEWTVKDLQGIIVPQSH